MGGPILTGLGVRIDYSLFILTRTRTGLRRGLSVEEAVTAAAGAAGRDVLFAGVTVCIALLGILTVRVSSPFRSGHRRPRSPSCSRWLRRRLCSSSKSSPS